MSYHLLHFCSVYVSILLFRLLTRAKTYCTVCFCEWFLPHTWKHDMLACFIFESVCNPEFDKYIVEKPMYNNPDKAKLTKEKTF